MVNNLNLDLFSYHQIIFSTLWKIAKMIKNYQWGNPEKFISDLFQLYSLNIEAQQVEILSKGAFLLPCTCVFTRYSWKILDARWLKSEEKSREKKAEYFSRNSFNPLHCMYSWGLKPSAPIQWMNDAKLCSSLHSKGSSHSIYIRTVSS